MKLSEKGAAFVRAHEGFVARYYLDPVKVGTIGIGFTWGSEAFNEWWGKNKLGINFGPGATMTRAEADDALRFMFDREYGKAVNDFLGKKKVPQHVFDGTSSPVYNLGPGSLKWKWAAAVKAGDYSEAARLLKTTGTTAKGKKLAGLVRRRKEEALLIEHGVYTGVDAAGITIPLAEADGVLVRREQGPAVAQLIRDLHKLGYYDGVLDDLFGPGTESAVLAFQRSNGLDDDGKVGPVTQAAIAKALAALKPPAAPVQPKEPEPAPVAAPEPVQPKTGVITLVAIAASSIAAYFGWGA